MPLEIIQNHIRIIPNYPKEGINFQDITPLLGNSQAFKTAIKALAKKLNSVKIDKIAAIEARGFIIGAALANYLSIGLIPIRKKGKLPSKTLSRSYELEYGMDTIEIHEDAIQKGENILLLDDIIATGGTALAAAELLQELEANIIGAMFITNLNFLGGAKQLKEKNIPIYSLFEVN